LLQSAVQSKSSVHGFHKAEDEMATPFLKTELYIPVLADFLIRSRINSDGMGVLVSDRARRCTLCVDEGFGQHVKLSGMFDFLFTPNPHEQRTVLPERI
jgi:hypothetical protein